MDQHIKFKWWDLEVNAEQEFTMQSSVIPPVGSSVAIPGKVGRVIDMHFIHSRFDGWKEIVIKLSPTSKGTL